MDYLDEIEDISVTINESCNSMKRLTGTKLITFAKGNCVVLKGACVDIGTSYKSYNAMDIHTGELYVIQEVLIATREKESCEQYLLKLTDLQHDNLFELKSFQFEHIDEGNWFLYILQKFDFGFLSMSLMSQKNISITNDMLKNITKNILSVIRYITIKEIDCISILASSVFIDNQGNVKVCNFGLDTFLTSCSNVDLSNQEKRNTLNLLADMLAALHGGDIILTFSEHFQEFLNKCRSATSCDLSVVEELLSHSFIQEPCVASSCTQLQNKSFDDDNSRFALERKCSRIESDFEIGCELGKGSFGKIYKVKDKVDEKYYALKVINLTTNHKENEKTIKEAKFLADLQHENIVRYYNSWTDDVLDDNIHDYYHSSPSTNDDDLDDTSLSGSNFHQSSLSSTSAGFIVDTSFDGLEDNELPVDQMDGGECNGFSALPSHIDRKALYIKMEFCESNTLESAIAKNLYLDENRIWRFLKEIVEGLHYIHNKNIIHRDLKPPNIFLDSNDHVKIGDFGLATTNQLYPSQDVEANSSQNGSYEVVYGTYYYRAPELSSSHTIIRDPKLDMYSLGVILFEMCYPPLVGHERHEVLKDLRSANIKFPSDFDFSLRHQQEILIRKLLNHDPEKRPNCHELRNSNCIPSLEEDERKMLMIRTLIDNPQSRMNKYLLEYLFTSASRNSINNIQRLPYVNMHQIENVTRVLFDVFKQYGGKNIDLPASSVQNICRSTCTNCIKLVDSQGSLMVLPCNNRNVLAKFVSLGRSTTWLRCYSSHKSVNCKSYSCDFDIITPIDLRKDQNYLPEAEILLILDEIRNSFVNLLPSNFTLYISHSSILEAIFEECDILSHSSYVSLISGYLPMDDRKALLSFYMKSKPFDKYLKILGTRGNLMDGSWNSAFSNFFRKPDLNQKVQKAIDELRNICRTAQRLGLTANLIFDPKCLLSNCQKKTGMLAELHYKVPSQRESVKVALAGRYDDYLNRVYSKVPMIRAKRFGVGITALLDNFKRVLDMSKPDAAEHVTVCYFSKTMPVQAVEVFKRLHSAKIPCSFIKMQSEKHQIEFCGKNDIACCILLKSNMIKNKILIRYRNSNRVIDINDVVPAVEIVLYCKRNWRLVVTKPIHFEAPIFFLTVPGLTEDEQFKCTIKILHKKDKMQDSIIFVVNSTKDLIKSFIDHCKMDEVIYNWFITLEYPFKTVCELLSEHNKEQVIFFNISDTDAIHIKDMFVFKTNRTLKKQSFISETLAVSPVAAYRRL
ncbi:hypothetical protein PPYR_00699 [Photinus pyralis]|uniref:Protein kinase domain-containing protein n=1 Tax=Photinus pyralis TaxID=7054 RepID=A0A5N4B293_PHOPY|nr:eIF-2-alpha kinase GCN2-like [Photinus pyralis]KAB0803729.1 hypothetical protein PPYR_00699 [Photinus pyralis]